MWRKGLPGGTCWPGAESDSCSCVRRRRLAASHRVSAMGQISPSIGINLFAIQGIWKGKQADAETGTIPFHLTLFVLLLLFFPDIALWLPSGGTIHRRPYCG